MELPTCVCGHRAAWHEMTAKPPRKHTWCTAHEHGHHCDCQRYEPALEDKK